MAHHDAAHLPSRDFTKGGRKRGRTRVLPPKADDTLNAALAAGRTGMAERLLAEQLEVRPHCQWAKARMEEVATALQAVRA
jgi:hypothetical protein